MINKIIIWSKSSLYQFEDAIQYIMSDSVQNAEKVRAKILLKISEFAETPDINPTDKYKTNNDGSYRACELFHYRITYRIIKNGIRIVRMRHTSMVPKYH